MLSIMYNLNWLAVVAATIAYSAFSGMWHRQFAFGKKWEAAMGFKRTENWKETGIYYTVPLLACFTTSVVVAVLQKLVYINSVSSAFTFGITLGIGFGLAITFTNAVIPTMKKPLVFGAITGTAHAFAISLVAVIIYVINHF